MMASKAPTWSEKKAMLGAIEEVEAAVGAVEARVFKGETVGGREEVRLAATILTRRITGAWNSVQDAPPSSITEIILAIILTLFSIRFANRRNFTRTLRAWRRRRGS